MTSILAQFNYSQSRQNGRPFKVAGRKNGRFFKSPNLFFIIYLLNWAVHLARYWCIRTQKWPEIQSMSMLLRAFLDIWIANTLIFLVTVTLTFDQMSPISIGLIRASAVSNHLAKFASKLVNPINYNFVHRHTHTHTHTHTDRLTDR